MDWSVPWILLVQHVGLVVGGVVSLGAMLAIGINILTGRGYDGQAQWQHGGWRRYRE
jgi:hypothetical protein